MTLVMRYVGLLYFVNAVSINELLHIIVVIIVGQILQSLSQMHGFCDSSLWTIYAALVRPALQYIVSAAYRT